MAYKKKAHKKSASSRRRSKKSAGVVGWVEHLFGLDKKKAKSSKRKASNKRKSHGTGYSLKARKSSSSGRKKYAR
jgi:hypothetical protein